MRPSTQPPADPAAVADTVAAYDVAATVSRFESGRVVAVRSDEVVMPDGARTTRDVVVHPGAVGVVVLDPDDRVLLLRQYRHPVRRMLWEPPAGLLDEPGEPPLDTARRELAEEAGMRARDWRVLLDVFTSPGMSDEAVRVYLARGLEELPAEQRQPGEHEEADMPLAWVELEEAAALALAGRLHNPLTVSGVLAALAARGRGFDTLRPADAPWPERPVSGQKG